MCNIINCHKNVLNQVIEGRPPISRESGGLIKDSAKKVSFATLARCREATRLDPSLWYTKKDIDKMREMYGD